MPKYQLIRKASHENQRWLKFTSFGHAAQDAVVPLVLQEFSVAARELPIGFIELRGSFTPVAVQGLKPGKNLLVARDGSWLGNYVPAKYRAYPFMLAPAEDGNHVLCIDEESNLLTSDQNGEAFFDQDGKPSPETSRIMSFLSNLETGRRVTEEVCAALHRHNLFKPWPLRIKFNTEDFEIAGLYQIDEQKLNVLPITGLDEIRSVGALPAIYMQLFSMSNIDNIARLAELAAKKESDRSGQPETIDLEYMNRGGTLSFENL